MARINVSVDSDDELPELSAILVGSGGGKPEFRGPTDPSSSSQESQRPPQSMQRSKARGTSDPNPSAKESRRQEPLRPVEFAKVDSLYFPTFPIREKTLNIMKTESVRSTSTPDPTYKRSIPKRAVELPVDYNEFASVSSDGSISLFGEDDSFTDLPGFIVPDFSSDDESPPRRPSFERKSRPLKTYVSQNQISDSILSNALLDRSDFSKKIDLTSPKIKEETAPRHGSLSINLVPPRSTSDKSNSPPQSIAFRKPQNEPHHITSLTTNSITRLQSPSKRHRILPSPQPPSTDAFWSEEVINNWNEQYSPKRTLKFPCELRSLSVDQDDDELPPSKSPRRSLAKTPLRKSKEVLERRKAFDQKKDDLAKSFLTEIDQIITQGRVAAIAESSGGIQIIWNKKLSSTAGRANWRKGVVRPNHEGGIADTISHRHHAFIELAEKVIDNEDRLLNVIAHEYCHLANFMISGIKDNPHGKEFKEWARKCTKAFSHRNITVTTKHSYAIAYKYIWECAKCSIEYKRHSKSIDPARHFCGICKGKLVQVQPSPRKGAGERKRNEYQDYVKKEYDRVRKENPQAGFGETMVILGREFRENKKAHATSQRKEPESEPPAKGGAKEPEPRKTELRVVSSDLDSMMKSLNILSLENCNE